MLFELYKAITIIINLATFFSFRMLFEERNKKKEKKEADCFAALERTKSQNQERKALEEKENA